MALPDNDTVIIDKHSIDAASFSIEGIADSAFQLFALQGYLVWLHKPELDSLKIRYRLLSIDFNQKQFHKNPDVINENIPFTAFTYTLKDTFAKGFVDFNSIDYNGTYGRSLAIGNSQDVALNSNFNLQLNGYILDSVRIEAAVTDNNLPVQPEGNTQQLQEFDRVYITFEKGKHKLTAGDYNLDRPNSYFINFTKRVQGLFYQDEFKLGNKVTNKMGLSASIAKGQFARNIFMGIEGNQGPYKLQGNNGEQFFIVLANTEKVYIDGLLMERGEDRDYVINYNTGEITFMPRQMITKDKRIQFEFEYQDRTYLNTLVYAYDELQIGKKWNVRFNVYSNQDSKNQPFTQTLSGEQKRFLAGIGDNTDQAFYKVITEDTFAANKILYKMTDTTVNGIFYDSVFVYTTHRDSAKYSLGFSFVGEGNGDYIVAGANTNGRSYAWIAPQDGKSQGSFAPVVLLITPKMQQLYTMATTYQIDSLKSVSVELGASNNAPNLFSNLDKDQHWGFSGRGIYNELRLLGKKDSLGTVKTTWTNELSYEIVQSRFKAIAPYREVEFLRDWNIAGDAPAADEHLANYKTALNRKGLGKMGYHFTAYQRGEDFKATRNIVTLDYDQNSVKGNATANVMQSSGAEQNSIYFRPTFNLEKTFKKLSDITLGTRFLKEYNSIKTVPSDTLIPAAFNFDVLNFYLKNQPSKKNHFQINYALRRDQIARNNAFITENTSQTIDGSININPWKNHQITLTGSYRNMVVNIPRSVATESGEAVLGRFEYNGNIRKGFIVPSLLFEAGTGQEQKRIYTYVAVNTGQGTHMWIDYNEDGVQQANEFEPAIYPDQRNFVRIITFTNEYVKVNFTTLNHSLQLNPENLWLHKRGKLSFWQKFASRFSDQLSLQINNRLLTDGGLNGFNPFATSFADTNIVSNHTIVSNAFFFNRSSARWGGDYTVAYNTGKSLLTFGLEGNNQLKHLVKLRWNLAKSFTLNAQLIQGNRGFSSALNDGRTYQIDYYGAEPTLTWIMRSAVRITGGYKYEIRQNRPLYGIEEATIHTLNLDSRIATKNLGTIQARGAYANIKYNGAANTSLSFVMLDALQSGANWLWHLNWERRLSRGIELSLEYEGRAPGNNPVIHTGRMSIRAIL